MKIAYVVGLALGELAQAKAVAFHTRQIPTSFQTTNLFTGFKLALFAG